MEKALYEELHRVERDHWWFRARRRIVWSLVERYLPDSKRKRLKVCELGCGTGGNLAMIAERHDVVGVECAPQGLELARRALGDRVHSGSLPDEVNLPNERFDVVLLTDVLEHIEQDAASAATAMRLLRPGGIVVATVPAYQWLYSPRDAHHHHWRRYGKNRFAELWRSASAETLLLSHYNAFLFPLAVTQRLASRLLAGVETQGDLKTPSAILNSLLSGVMSSETNLLGRIPVPFGLSLIAVVRKRQSAATMRAAAA
jgi:2-polyprenyl-3-methyl-5-hydroxy-6-metoxy-1,4-benzoquinol methylase